VRHQKFSKTNFDLVSESVHFFVEFETNISPETLPVMRTVLEAMTEMVQGPCKENQNALVKAKLLRCSNRFLREYLLGRESIWNSVPKSRHAERRKFRDDVIDLKSRTFLCICSLLEGRNDDYMLGQVTTSLDFKVMRETLRGNYEAFFNDEAYKGMSFSASFYIFQFPPYPDSSLRLNIPHT
jgi:hypothetical protein